MWDRIASLYCEFQDARHAVAHRAAPATAAGNLEIYDDQRPRQLTDTVTAAEIVSFIASVHVLAELVVESDDDQRRANIVTWHLNELTHRHGLPPLPATDPYLGRRVLQADLETIDRRGPSI